MTESKSFSQKALDASLNGVYVFDLRIRRNVYVNGQYTALTGYSMGDLDEMEEARFMGLFHPDDIPRVEEHLERIGSGVGDPSEIEYRFRTKDGRWIWCLSRDKAFSFGEDGSVFQIVGAFLDITERKQTEEELVLSRAHLAWVLDKTGMGTWLNELPLGRLNWDDQTKRLFFVPPDSEPTIGLFWSRLHPDDRKATKAAVEKALREGAVYSINHRAVCPETGEIRWVRSIGQAMYAEDGTPLRFDGVNFDITKQMETEIALKKINETLEEQVAGRTMLAEARARQLQALAVELTEAEERERRKIATLLHDDLQQILASAKLQLHAARASGGPASILENVLYLIDESIVKSRGLSRDLSPPVLLNSDFGGALVWLAGQMVEKFGLRVELATDGERRIGHHSLKVFLFRAVQELLFNIVKHAGAKSALVEVSESDRDLVVAVSDQGRGFDGRALERSGTSAGLGLASIRERASYFGGDLKVESAPGKGSRFTLKVPLGLAKAEESGRVSPDRREPSPRPAGLPVSETKESFRVLFVDDHEVIRRGLIRLIGQNPGIEVAGEAANGNDAVEMVRRLEPDVVLMDVSMPEMDGIEATRRIKAEMPEIRVIGLSMHEDENIAAEMRRAGAEAFLIKTASSAELLGAVYGSEAVGK